MLYEGNQGSFLPIFYLKESNGEDKGKKVLRSEGERRKGQKQML
jgi:hypothetical protein